MPDIVVELLVLADLLVLAELLVLALLIVELLVHVEFASWSGIEVRDGHVDGRRCRFSCRECTPWRSDLFAHSCSTCCQICSHRHHHLEDSRPPR